LFDRIKDIVLFETDDGKLSLPQYFERVGRMNYGEDTRRIFYFTKAGGAGQQAMLFKAKGYSVIDASGFPDLEFLMKYARTTPNIELHRLDLDALGFVLQPLIGKERKWRELETAFVDLQVNAEVVRFTPDSVPAILLENESGDEFQARELLQDPGLSPTIKRLLQGALEQRQRAGRETGKRTLYLNADNSIVSSLAQFDVRDTEVMEIVSALYNNALLGSLQTTKPMSLEDVQGIFNGNTNSLAAFISKLIEVKMLRAEISALRKTYEPEEEADPKESSAQEPEPEHVVCFFAAPFDQKYNVLMEALRSVLEDAPYFWEVARADERYFERSVSDNVTKWISRAHCYAVEISERNPNVMMELGQIYWGYPARPLLILQREGIEEELADLAGTLRVHYPWASKPNREEIVRSLKTNIERFTEIDGVRNKRHYLSAYAMQDMKWIDQDARNAVANQYSTIEELLEKNPNQVAEELRERVPIPPELVKIIQDGLREKLKRSTAAS